VVLHFSSPTNLARLRPLDHRVTYKQPDPSGFQHDTITVRLTGPTNACGRLGDRSRYLTLSVFATEPVRCVDAPRHGCSGAGLC
jgi:hypothetical protein